MQEERSLQPGEPAVGDAVAQVGVDDLVTEQVERARNQHQPDHRGEYAGRDGGPGQGAPGWGGLARLRDSLDGAGRGHPSAPPMGAPDGAPGRKKKISGTSGIRPPGNSAPVCVR